MRAPPALFPPALLSLALLPGCLDDVFVTWPDDTGAWTGPIVLTDADNYTSGAALELPTVQTAERVGVGLQWGDLAQDLACADLDPAVDVQSLLVASIQDVTVEDFAAGLLAGSIRQSWLASGGQVETGGATSIAWDDIGIVGTGSNPSREYVEGSGPWIAALFAAPSREASTVALMLLEPRADSRATRASFPDPCGTLTYAADLVSHGPVAAPTDGPWTLDWSALTTDGRGSTFEPAQVVEVVLGRYDTATPADLADPLYDLDDRADELRRWTVDGVTSLDLAATPDVGPTLTSLDPAATWMVSLRCAACADPAPLFLTALAPE